MVGQAKRFSQEIADGVKQSAGILQQAALEGLRREIDTMVPLVQQVIRQTKARILEGDTRTDKLFSIFGARIPSCATSSSEPAHFGSSCGGIVFMLWSHRFCPNKSRERLQHRFEHGSKNMLRLNGFLLKPWAD